MKNKFPFFMTPTLPYRPAWMLIELTFIICFSNFLNHPSINTSLYLIFLFTTSLTNFSTMTTPKQTHPQQTHLQQTNTHQPLHTNHYTPTTTHQPLHTNHYTPTITPQPLHTNHSATITPTYPTTCIGRQRH